MSSPSHILSRIFFWSYERGVWQYDLAVVLILIFVLLTPSHWFHDQPNQSGNSATTSHQVLLLSSSDNKQIYQVDSRLLALPERMPALQNQLHVALQKSLPELQNGHFSIAKVEAVRNEQGIVVAYKVEVYN